MSKEIIITTNAPIEYNIADGAIAELEEKYGSLAVNGLEDKEAAKAVIAAHKDVKGYFAKVEAKRKDLSKNALAYQRAVNEEAKRIKGKLEPIREHLESERNKYETLVKEEKARKQREAEERINARVEALQAVNASFDYPKLLIMKDEDFEEFLAEKTAEFEEIERKAKIEAERLEREAEEREKARLEQEERNREREAEIARKEAELAAKEAELRKAQEEAEAKERERLDAIRKEKEEKELRERLEREAQEKAKAEKEEAERLERERIAEEERIAELAPDKINLKAYLETIETLVSDHMNKRPRMKTKKGEKVLRLIEGEILEAIKTGTELIDSIQ